MADDTIWLTLIEEIPSIPPFVPFRRLLNTVEWLVLLSCIQLSCFRIQPMITSPGLYPFFFSEVFFLFVCSPGISRQTFGLNASHFGNSTVYGISGNDSWKFLYHLPLFPNFRKVWLDGKRP